eukprot:TRINITY_DN23624_c0_g1_i1.p1 TRINITY_DN23624_c0_g1~~TRINITY_DN23624_c0_g1_i1.p1  ORF type:complete len:275 (-),score=18.47 TRINITY_DN23624_c0_g1_i1:31-855(-)
MGWSEPWIGIGSIFTIWNVILWNIFFVLKIDGVINWAWYFVFIPLWLAAPGSFVFIFFLIDEFRRGSERWIGGLVWLLLCGGGFYLWTALLVAKLEMTNFMPWYFVMIPLWVSLVGCYLIDEHWPDYKYEFQYPMYKGRWGYSYGQRYETFRAFGRILPGHTITAIIVFTVLVALDAEKILVTDWAVKWIPFWWLICLVWFIVITCIVINPSRWDDMIVFPMLSVSVPMVFLLLVGLWLCGAIETTLAVVWIPLWIPGFIVFFASFALCCCCYY